MGKGLGARPASKANTAAAQLAGADPPIDCVLLDLRTGFAKVTNRVLADVADCLVALSHPLETHQKETDRLIRHAADLRRHSKTTPLPLIRATTMVPANAERPSDQIVVGYHPQICYADALAHDKTIRGAIDWQYKLLSQVVAEWARHPGDKQGAREIYRRT